MAGLKYILLSASLVGDCLVTAGRCCWAGYRVLCSANHSHSHKGLLITVSYY